MKPELGRPRRGKDSRRGGLNRLDDLRRLPFDRLVECLWHMPNKLSCFDRRVLVGRPIAPPGNKLGKQAQAERWTAGHRSAFKIVVMCQCQNFLSFATGSCP
jgi:hypothetical protein